MDANNPLIGIGQLAQPVTTFIEKVSDAVEGIAKPAQIVRTARAQAEADKILALSQLDITEIRQRALTRLVLEEARRQENMEAIFRKSLPEITEEAKPERLNNDWIAHFFDKCRLISDEDMQNLWAQVLSGQTNVPGSYSKKTIEILANLEKADADLFTKVCSFSVQINTEPEEEPGFPLIYDVSDNVYKNNGLNFVSLAHLESLGLLHHRIESGYVVSDVAQRPDIFYFNRRIPVELPYPEKNQFVTGQIMLTQAGLELSMVCKIEPIDGFIEYLEEKWQTFRYLTGPDIENDAPPEDEDKQPSD